MKLGMGSQSFVSRSAEFSALLSQCEITGKNGKHHELEQGLVAAMQMLAHVRESDGSVYIIGNGGSASIASHAAIDLLHIAKIRTFTLHDPALLTCMANDYGYENVFSKALAQVAKSGDVLVAISSSGKSENICHAAAQMTHSGGGVITFSGFSSSNPLRSLGGINIWLDSSDYGMVEIGHQFILHNMADRFAAGFEG